MEYIMDYARKCVGNKTVAQRIGHSAKLHMFRSAISSKGSAGSKALKLAGVGVRAALGKIPLPAVGSIATIIQQTAENKTREWHHKRRKRNANDLKTQVKFELKELSVENMDRFRWKVTEALGSLNKASDAFPTKFSQKQKEGATCNALLEYAMAFAQAERRVERLEAQCEMLEDVAAKVRLWLKDVVHEMNKCRGVGGGPTLDKVISEELKTFAAYQQQGDSAAEAWKDENHGKCDKWCCFAEAGKPDNYANAKDMAAKILRFITSEIEVDKIPEIIISSKDYADKHSSSGG